MKARNSLRASMLALFVTVLSSLVATPLAHAQYPGVNGEIMVQATVPRIGSAGVFQRIVLMDPDSGEITRQLSADWGSKIQINFGPTPNTWVTNYSGQPNNNHMWRFHLNAQGSVNENGIHLPSSTVSPAFPYHSTSSCVGSGWNTSVHPDFLPDGSVVYLKQAHHPVPDGQPLGDSFTTVHLWKPDESVICNHVFEQLPGEFPRFPQSLAASPVRNEAYVTGFVSRTPEVGGYQQGIYRYDIDAASYSLLHEARESFYQVNTARYAHRDTMSVEDVSPDGEQVLLIQQPFYDGPEYGQDGEAPLYQHEINAWVANELKLMPRSGGDGSVIWESPPGHRIISAKFSPDNERVAFTVTNPLGNPVPPPTLHVMDLGGGNHDVYTVRAQSTGNVPTVATAATEVGWHPIPVVSDFDITPDTTKPGTFKYTSKAAQNSFEGLSLWWDFGNGESGSDGFIEIAEYDEPGTYDVTHRVTAVIDGEDVTGETTKQVVVEAPELGASLSWDEDIESEDGRLPLNKTFPGKIVISASGDGVGALSNLAFDDDTFATISPDGILDVTSEDDVPEPFTLDPGKKREFPVEITTTARGEVTISGGVTGEDAAGNPVEATFSRTKDVGHDFEIEVESKLVEPDGDLVDYPVGGVELEIDEASGLPKPRDVVFDIEVKNVSGADAKDTTFDLRALTRDREIRNPTSPLPLVFTRYQVQRDERPEVLLPADTQLRRNMVLLPELANQDTVTVRVWGRVQDKVFARASVIVRGMTDEEEPRAISGSGRSEDLRVDQPAFLLIDGSTDTPSQVRAGEEWVFSGHM